MNAKKIKYALCSFILIFLTKILLGDGDHQRDGKLDLIDGPFLQMINTAKDDPESKYAIIIEEINRGNPAQIFGEMLTLLESDKRNED